MGEGRIETKNKNALGVHDKKRGGETQCGEAPKFFHSAPKDL